MKKRNITWGDKISKALKNSEKAAKVRKKATLIAAKKNKGRIPWNKGLKYELKNRKGKLTGDDNPSKRKEVREKISKKLKELYKSGKANCGFKSESSKENIRKVLAKYPKISKAEIKVEKWLVKNEISFVSQWSYKYGVADFYIPDKNLVLECYGKYWHNLPNYKERDKKKNAWLLNNNYNLKIVWSEDVLDCENLNKMLGEVL